MSRLPEYERVSPMDRPIIQREILLRQQKLNGCFGLPIDAELKARLDELNRELIEEANLTEDGSNVSFNEA